MVIIHTIGYGMVARSGWSGAAVLPVGAAVCCRVSLGWGKYMHLLTPHMGHPGHLGHLGHLGHQGHLGHLGHLAIQVLISLQLELILLQWHSTGAHGSLETTFKVLLKST